MSDHPPFSHFAAVWHRPRSQGGDARQPLCRTPPIGVCGAMVGRWSLTDNAAAVDCPACQAELAAGGVGPRRARLLAALARDNGRPRDVA